MDITTLMPEAVQWSEGMLLSPQHLQQNDIYWSHQLRHLAGCLQPYYWGLLDLAYDEAALATGNLRITRLHAVMPDGVPVQYPGHHTDDYGQPLTLDLKTIEGWSEGPLRVFVGIPIRAEGAASVTSRIQRFNAVPGRLEVDENSGEDRMEVGRLRPRLQLLPGIRIPAKYESFPLLEVVRDAVGHFHVGPYHPPLLRFCAATFLEERQISLRLNALTETMRGKIRDLVGGREVADNVGRLDRDGRQQLYAARHLASMLPLLELRLRAGVSHPHDIYMCLAAMAGQIAALGANPTPPVLDAYRHEDFLPGMLTLLSYIETRLALLNAPFEAMLFERLSPTSFMRPLPEELRPDALVIEVRGSDGVSPASLRQWMQHARVASDDLMPVLEQRRLPGASVRQLPANQYSGLNVSDGALLFEISNKAIDVGDKLVPVIRQGRPLLVQGPMEGQSPREIVLHLTRSMQQSKPQAAVDSHEVAHDD
ncbi:type VI secretion system baseplate subunit TssK [Chitinimonas sp. JJ19]|uniref:type VI secretion system baseplate subunit TssK n=1 Tax=Chitinimonas sp. JJ19 TaxID=3109352 RepID=UPI0030016836